LSKDFLLDPLFQKESKGKSLLKHLDLKPFQPTPFDDSSSHFHQFLKELESKLLKEAKEKAIYIEKEAYEKGFAQGEVNGMELGRKRFEILVEQFQKLLQEMSQKRMDLYRSYEIDLIHLTFSVIKKIIQQEISMHEDIIKYTLREAFKYVVDRQKIIIRLNPTDYQYITSSSLGDPFLKESIEGIKLMEDPKIKRGGCFIETSFGDIDATIESQIEEIASFIFEKINHSQQ
jgi:flagellar assembly protein FliH